MSTKLQYLHACVVDGRALETKTWYITALGIPTPTAQAVRDPLPYQLVRRASGMHYLQPQPDGTLQECAIVDAPAQQPLFSVKEPLSADSTWLSSIQGKVETTVGRMLVNAAALYPTLGARVPYQNALIKVSQLETLVGQQMQDDESADTDSGQIKVSEYIECMDRLFFFTKISSLVSVAATPKTVLPAPGTAQLRHKLLQEHGDKLHDPVVIASVIKALNQHDMAYLQDDAAASIILGKKGNTARKKLFQIYGETNDFGNALSSDPITGVMEDGVDTSKDVFPKYINDLRYASYSRGHSTRLSGYSYKILQRSLSGLEVADTACKTTRGLMRTVHKPEQLVNRYVKLSKDWKLISDIQEAKEWVGKSCEVRSVMYCTSAGNTLCYQCLGENFKGSKNAINNIAAHFSGELMTLFLKRMHTSGFNLTQVKIPDLLS